ncbi:glycosyltransferase [Maritimibacter sp. DP4N28-5]|uniref:Glycosyltransferase n=1 Tax=Maritimibacter dapengensis TaxID=2836868 RepID=A0ABS6SYC0_9RHOB|nr:glycosyltransferase [Maritimibacter dapengensis]
MAAGWDVTIVSGHRPGPEGAAFDVAHGISCVRLNERDAEHLPTALRYGRYLTMGARSRAWVSQQSTPPAAIILYSGYSPYLLQFTDWARRRGIPIIFDAVEWYTAPSAIGFATSPYLWNVELAMRVLIPRCDGVIAISSALERYYARRSLATCRIPPLIDVSETPEGAPGTCDGPLKLVYAGQPGRKDLIDAVIKAVVAVDGGCRRLHLDIVGMTPEDLKHRPALRQYANSLPDCIAAHGILPHSDAVEFVARADFTVFMREINRVSTNGFSTKFVESLSFGTPVITNFSGDLSHYLQHHETGLICASPSEEALAAVLQDALSIPSAALGQMRKAARAEAKRSFDYQSQVATLRCFIDTMVAGK